MPIQPPVVPCMISLKFRHRSDRLDGGPYLWKGIESPMATTTSAAASAAYSPCPNARQTIV